MSTVRRVSPVTAAKEALQCIMPVVHALIRTGSVVVLIEKIGFLLFRS